MIPILISTGRLRGRGANEKVYNVVMVVMALAMILLLACSCGGICLAIASVVWRALGQGMA